MFGNVLISERQPITRVLFMRPLFRCLIFRLAERNFDTRAPSRMPSRAELARANTRARDSRGWRRGESINVTANINASNRTENG